MKNKAWYAVHLHIYMAVFLAIQPLLDVASFWLQKLGMSTAPTLALRMALLAISVLIAFFLAPRKRAFWIAAGAFLFLGIGHIFACIQEGYSNPFSDLTNFVRIIQMPLLVLCFITFMRLDDRCFEGMQLGVSSAFLIILLVELLSVVTGTDPHTYILPEPSGILGWFYFANSQCAILSMAIPICLAWQLSWKKKRPVLFCTTAILGCLVLYYLGSRLAYLALMVITVGLCVTILLICRANWKYAVFLGMSAVVFAFLLPYSPMFRHINYDSYMQDTRQNWIYDSLGEKKDEVEKLLEKQAESKNEIQSDSQKSVLVEKDRQRLIKELTPVYETYVPDFVETFGVEKTIEMFNYTINVRDFSSVRAKKLMFAKTLMSESGLASHLFGLELSRFTVNNSTYDVENDFHGIFYLQGGVGLAAYLLYLAYFVGLILWALIKSAKRYFTFEAAGYGIAFLLCMANVYNTAGVLRRPNASVFLSVVLAGIYYLVKIRSYPDCEKQETKR